MKQEQPAPSTSLPARRTTISLFLAGTGAAVLGAAAPVACAWLAAAATAATSWVAAQSDEFHLEDPR